MRVSLISETWGSSLINAMSHKVVSFVLAPQEIWTWHAPAAVRASAGCMYAHVLYILRTRIHVHATTLCNTSSLRHRTQPKVGIHVSEPLSRQEKEGRAMFVGMAWHGYWSGLCKDPPMGIVFELIWISCLSSFWSIVLSSNLSQNPRFLRFFSDFFRKSLKKSEKLLEILLFQQFSRFFQNFSGNPWKNLKNC